MAVKSLLTSISFISISFSIPAPKIETTRGLELLLRAGRSSWMKRRRVKYESASGIWTPSAVSIDID